MQVPLCDACDTVMTQCCSCRGFVESIFCCLWSSQWLNLLYNYIQYIQVPLCDACDTVITLWWLSVAQAEALHWRSCGLVESIFCCLWSSQWLNLLYNYAHCIQYMQVPLCDACDTVMTQAEALHWRSCGLVESIFCCLWSSQWLNLLYNYIQYMQVPLCDACDTVMTQAEALHWRSCGLVESIFCCLWSSQWLVCVRLAALSPAVKERLPRAMLDLQPQLKAVGTLLTTVCLHHGLHRAVHDLVALHTAAVDGDGSSFWHRDFRNTNWWNSPKLKRL